MLIVSFDIATEKMFLVIERDNEVLEIHHEFSTPEKYNSAMLIPSLLKLFEKNQLKPNQISLIAINIGPGSFTGIRAGTVIARTMGQSLNIPIVGVPSLEIYANACDSNKDKMVILDARRKKWYTGLYNKDNVEIQPPQLSQDTEVLDFLHNNEMQIITENSLMETLKDFSPVNFTEIETDFGLVLTQLAKQKIEKSKNYKEEFEWFKLKPVYLQTPSITMPKKVRYK